MCPQVLLLETALYLIKSKLELTARYLIFQGCNSFITFFSVGLLREENETCQVIMYI